MSDRVVRPNRLSPWFAGYCLAVGVLTDYTTFPGVVGRLINLVFGLGVTIYYILDWVKSRHTERVDS
jgi:hypothetical protein